MKDSGSRIRPMVRELMNIETVPSTTVTGKKIDQMALVLRRGQVEQSSKATISKERRSELASSPGSTDLSIVESSTTTISTERGLTNGPMAANTRASGEQTKCTAKEHSSGKMEESMSASTVTTRKRVTESSAGQTAGATGASGPTVGKTEREPTSPAKARRNMASGKMAKGSDGSVVVKLTESN